MIEQQDAPAAPACPECGGPVVGRGTRRPAVYCSARCKSAAGHQRTTTKAAATDTRSVPRAERGAVTTSEIEYSDEETEFLKAVDQYKRTHKKPFPTLTELLAVLRSLGWRRVAKGSEGSNE